MDNRDIAAVLVLGLLVLAIGPFDATPHAGLDDLIWAVLSVIAVGYWAMFLRWIRTV